MIIASLNSGLGNQMFQYAAAKALAERHHTELKLDLSWFQTHSYRKYQLNHFNITAKAVTGSELQKFTGKYRLFPQRLLWYITGMNRHYRYFREASFDFDSGWLDCGPDTIIDGYWQSEQYFCEIAGTIVQEFSVASPLSEKSREMKTYIQNTESVAVHIRRGDYVMSGIKESVIHGPLESHFYDDALAIIARKTRSPHLFIFSDDIPWVKENLRFDFPARYVDHNDESSGFEDLHLMSECRHNIIANSTFSWWGAWLNRNPSKIVIAPKQWFPDPKMNKLTSDLIPDSWVRL
ncbi:MAG: alpha-1,2-fucosyltransferase [Chlorobiaceae bacterium]|nr:alpha-1,2-fucosyltransferase [Chlorobiaceae bacterium]